MLSRLFLLFVLVPMADLILLLMIAQIHWLWSVAAIVISALVGAFLIRLQGITVARSFRRSVASGQIPTEPLIQGGMVVLAAGLLLTPGLLTDLFGISLLIPKCRRWYQRRLVNWLKNRYQVTQAEFHAYTDRSTVDAEFIRKPVKHPVDPFIEEDSSPGER